MKKLSMLALIYLSGCGAPLLPLTADRFIVQPTARYFGLQPGEQCLNTVEVERSTGTMRLQAANVSPMLSIEVLGETDRPDNLLIRLSTKVTIGQAYTFDIRAIDRLNHYGSFTVTVVSVSRSEVTENGKCFDQPNVGA